MSAQMQAEEKRRPSARLRLARIVWRIETFLCLALARFLSSFIPMRYWRGMLGDILTREAEGQRVETNPDGLEKALIVGRWVNVMAARVPFEAVCLQKAMAARWMLNRRKVPTRLFIGVRLDDARNMEGHAWLMYGDQYLTGGEEREGFVTLQKQPSSKTPNA